LTQKFFLPNYQNFPPLILPAGKDLLYGNGGRGEGKREERVTGRTEMANMM
jgi:hypothetical protein